MINLWVIVEEPDKKGFIFNAIGIIAIILFVLAILGFTYYLIKEKISSKKPNNIENKPSSSKEDAKVIMGTIKDKKEKDGSYFLVISFDNGEELELKVFKGQYHLFSIGQHGVVDYQGHKLNSFSEQ